MAVELIERKVEDLDHKVQEIDKTQAVHEYRIEALENAAKAFASNVNRLIFAIAGAVTVQVLLSIFNSVFKR